MSLQLDIGPIEGRETHIGRLTAGEADKLSFVSEDVTGPGCATVTGLDDGREHSFRLLGRWELFELYVDDLLVQTYTHQLGTGKVGFVVRDAEAGYSDLRAWEMSYPKPDPNRVSPPIKLAHP